MRVAIHLIGTTTSTALPAASPLLAIVLVLIRPSKSLRGRPVLAFDYLLLTISSSPLLPVFPFPLDPSPVPSPSSRSFFARRMPFAFVFRALSDPILLTLWLVYFVFSLAMV